MLNNLKVPATGGILARASGWGVLVFLVSIGAQWLVYEMLLGDPGGMRLISPAVAALATTVLAFELKSVARSRTEATLKQFQTIAEMNHHIRNALQVISYQASLGNDDRGHVREALDRIEWVLRDVLPTVIEGPAAPADSLSHQPSSRPTA